eukprot:TRINITY_DN5289_c1_g1_i1.p1 TRINITY_DN5289_c1_g1~~TRINITY_DN5289_c1_g1_i1.p1  ORF type:complete len:479 (+),score=84.28 TRINITY_DN5289_c1_g1_i1:177-1439(+)
MEHVGSLLCIILLALDGFTYPLHDCIRGWWNAFLVFPFTCLPIIIRSYVYCFRFYLTKERDHVTTPKLMKYVRLISPSFIVKVTAVCLFALLVPLGVGSIVLSLQPGGDAMARSCPWDRAIFIIDMALAALVIVCWIVAIVFLWKARDYYKIKEEMVFNIGGWIITLVVYALSGNIGIRLPFFSAIFIIAGLEITFVLHAWLLTFLYKDVKIDVDMDFDRCLASRRTREKFRNFLVYQLCVENLLFCEELQRFKSSSPSSTNVYSSAKTIYDNYIKEGSMYQVNISSETHKAIKSGLDLMRQIYTRSADLTISNDPASSSSLSLPGDRSLFDTAEVEVLGMLRFHSFPFFVRLYGKANGKSGGGGSSSAGSPIQMSSSFQGSSSAGGAAGGVSASRQSRDRQSSFNSTSSSSEEITVAIS